MHQGFSEKFEFARNISGPTTWQCHMCGYKGGSKEEPMDHLNVEVTDSFIEVDDTLYPEKKYSCEFSGDFFLTWRNL